MSAAATMCAATLTGFGGLEMLELRDDVPVPEPGAEEVVVEVTAASLNNTDIWTREGAYGLPGQPDALAGWRGPIAFPRVQGGDIAGRIVAVGAAVEAARVGERVVVDPAIYDRDAPDANPVGLLGSEADGGFAQYVSVAAERAHDVSNSPLADEQLACLPIAYGTAMGMLERARVKAGETVLVTGASGGVGFALVQLAVARRACVIAMTSAHAAEPVRAAGAHGIVLRDDRDVAGAIASAAPAGLDAVADVVGGASLAPALSALRDGGRCVIAGAVAGPIVDFDLRRLYLHNRTLIGSSMHTPAHFERLVEAARGGAVAPRVAATYPLSEIREAQRTFLRRDHVGKLVVIPKSSVQAQ